LKAPDAAKSDVLSTKHGDQPLTAAAMGDAAPARREGRAVTATPVIADPGEAKPHASVAAALSLIPEKAQAAPLSDRKERAQPGFPTQAGAQSPLAAPVVPITAHDRGGVPAPVPQTIAAAPAAERFEMAAVPAAGVTDLPAAPAVAPPVMAAAAPVPVPGTVAGLAQALAAEVLNMAADGAWIDELARDISRMASGAGDLRFRLTPESLGELRVEISQSERGALVRMSVTSEAAQAALAEAQPKLLAEARAQGVRIADAQVDLASSYQHKGDTQRQQPDQAGRPAGAPRANHNEMRPAAGTAAGRTDRYA
jgi:flagellar hook-length control protein FliK